MRRSKHVNKNSSANNTVQWLGLSLTLLFVYLGFFHLCLESDPATCIVLGVGGWLLWSAICIVGRSVFRNRFEFMVHLVVGLDLLLEGFNPDHAGYGFYLCALGFWAIFVTYHFLGMSVAVSPLQLQPEMADSGV